jgi:hypothetical protein
MTTHGCQCASHAPLGYLTHGDRRNGDVYQCPQCLQKWIHICDQVRGCEWIASKSKRKREPLRGGYPTGRGPRPHTSDTFEEVPMAVKPPAPSTALATIPHGLPFEEAEWTAMSPTEQQDALIFFREETAATTEGLQVTFPRAKFPTSGSSFWELPSVTGEPEAAKEIEGVVVFKQNTRAWWRGVDGNTSFEITNTAPTCSSLDGVTPVESEDRQAETCAKCPHSKWDTGKEGRGQACKSRLNCFILRPGDEIPTLISLPPTAIKPFAAYAVGLRQKKSALIATTTIFGLQDAKSSGGTAYKGIALRMGKALTFAEMKAARAISDAFESAMAQRGIQVDEAAGEEPEPPGAEG